MSADFDPSPYERTPMSWYARTREEVVLLRRAVDRLAEGDLPGRGREAAYERYAMRQTLGWVLGWEQRLDFPLPDGGRYQYAPRSLCPQILRPRGEAMFLAGDLQGRYPFLAADGRSASVAVVLTLAAMLGWVYGFGEYFDGEAERLLLDAYEHRVEFYHERCPRCGRDVAGLVLSDRCPGCRHQFFMVKTCHKMKLMS